MMNFYGVKGFENVFFFKDIDDVCQICNQVIQNFELVCFFIMLDEECKRLFFFVISGGGLIGVEFVVEFFDFFNEDLIWYFFCLLCNEIFVYLI